MNKKQKTKFTILGISAYHNNILDLKIVIKSLHVFLKITKTVIFFTFSNICWIILKNTDTKNSKALPVLIKE